MLAVLKLSPLIFLAGLIAESLSFYISVKFFEENSVQDCYFSSIAIYFFLLIVEIFYRFIDKSNAYIKLQLLWNNVMLFVILAINVIKLVKNDFAGMVIIIHLLGAFMYNLACYMFQQQQNQSQAQQVTPQIEQPPCQLQFTNLKQYKRLCIMCMKPVNTDGYLCPATNESAIHLLCMNRWKVVSNICPMCGNSQYALSDYVNTLPSDRSHHLMNLQN